MPPLPVVRSTNVATTPPEREIHVERRDVEVAVIGGGPAGRAAADAAVAEGKDVLVLDAGDGIEVVAIYPGSSIVARTPHGMLHLRAARSSSRPARRSSSRRCQATTWRVS